MALYNTKGNKLTSTYTNGHWDDFSKFTGSKLHEIFVFLIEQELMSAFLNSRIIGKKILRNIEKINPTLLKNQGDTQPNQLFGMTLWNFLSNQEESWEVEDIEQGKIYTLIGL